MSVKKSDLTLTTVVDAVVEIVGASIKRGEEITADEIAAAVTERYPDAEPLLPLAFPRAAERLRVSIERDRAHADALRRWHDQRHARP